MVRLALPGTTNAVAPTLLTLEDDRLIVCGVLKIVYDLSLLFSFRHIKPPEEKKGSR